MNRIGLNRSAARPHRGWVSQPRFVRQLSLASAGFLANWGIGGPPWVSDHSTDTTLKVSCQMFLPIFKATPHGPLSHPTERKCSAALAPRTSSSLKATTTTAQGCPPAFACVPRFGGIGGPPWVSDRRSDTTLKVLCQTSLPIFRSRRTGFDLCPDATPAHHRSLASVGRNIKRRIENKNHSHLCAQSLSLKRRWFELPVFERPESLVG